EEPGCRRQRLLRFLAGAERAARTGFLQLPLPFLDQGQHEQSAKPAIAATEPARFTQPAGGIRELLLLQSRERGQEDRRPQRFLQLPGRSPCRIERLPTLDCILVEA